MRPAGRGAPRARARGRGGLRGNSATGQQTSHRGARTVHFSTNAKSTDAQQGSTSSLGDVSQNAPGTRPHGRSATALSAHARSAQVGGLQPSSYQDRYQQLKHAREKERVHAIANGFLADPDRPRTLAEAITPVGTCPDMCPEFERLERTVQNDVWGPEVDHENPGNVPGSSRQLPDEARMVKKFRRAAAGLDEQLPSDLRPPPTLKKTIDYLFNDLLAQSSLISVHHFVWDRTRAIRNDFSIQQVSKAEQVRVAIECYERIARFHIVSLHELAQPEKPYEKYDAQQEREQLDKTLLSLMQLYEDNRKTIRSPNEAEFRAYCIIFQIQDPVPDLEDRVQTWPEHIASDDRVKKALALYAAACNSADAQGPLKPRTHHPIARANWRRFWLLVRSQQISYLMACVAEIYFALLRRTALHAIWRAYRSGANTRSDDWPVGELADVFAMDNEQAVVRFCEGFGFSFVQREDGVLFLDLMSVAGRQLPEPSIHIGQERSMIVEAKRHGRNLPAIINGFSVREATEAGMIYQTNNDGMDDHDMSNESSLFIPEQSSNFKAPPAAAGITQQPALNPFATAFNPSTLSAPSESAQIGPTNQTNANSLGKTSAPSAFGSKISTNPFLTSTTSTTPTGSGASSTPCAGFGITPTSSSAPINAAILSGKTPLAPAVAPPTMPTFGSRLFPNSTSGPAFSFAGNTTPDVPQSSSQTLGQPESVKMLNTAQAAAADSSASVDAGHGPAASESHNTSFCNSFNLAPPVGSTQTSSSSPFASFQFPLPSTASAFPSTTSTFPSTANNANLLANTIPKPLEETSIIASTPSFNFNQSTSTPLSTPAIAPLPRTSTFSTSYPATAASSISSPFRNPSNLSQQSLVQFAPPTASVVFGEQQQPNATVQTQATVPASSTGPDGIFASSTGSSDTWLSASNQLKQPASTTQPSTVVGLSSTEIAIAKQAQHSETLLELSHKLLTEPGGLLEQFVDFIAAPIVSRLQNEVAEKRLLEQAQGHRLVTLSYKYGKRWRNIVWSRRQIRKGAERRARLARDALKRSTNSRETSIAAIDEQIESMTGNVGRQGKSSVRSGRRQLRQEHEARVTARLSSGGEIGSTLGGSTTSRGSWQDNHESVQPQDRRRSLSSSTSSRQRSVVPPASTRRQDTTRSSYFKMKALGLDPTLALANSHASRPPKRTHSNDDVPRSGKRLLDSRISSSPPLQIMDVPTSSSRREVPDAEDEELFAAVRAARDAMSESITFFKEEMAKDELGRSKSSAGGEAATRHDSPSLKHRLPMDFDRSLISTTSHQSSPSGQPPLKYRSRVSKFLPREMYADFLMEKQGQEHKTPRFAEPPGNRQGTDLDNSQRQPSGLEQQQLSPRTSSQTQRTQTLAAAALKARSNPFGLLSQQEQDDDSEASNNGHERSDEDEQSSEEDQLSNGDKPAVETARAHPDVARDNPKMSISNDNELAETDDLDEVEDDDGFENEHDERSDRDDREDASMEADEDDYYDDDGEEEEDDVDGEDDDDDELVRAPAGKSGASVDDAIEL